MKRDYSLCDEPCEEQHSIWQFVCGKERGHSGPHLCVIHQKEAQRP
jgi:hypothetical protein